MKQRISCEQLDELTVDQKQKLREWGKPEIGDWFYHTFRKRTGNVVDNDIKENLSDYKSITTRLPPFSL